MKRPAVLPEVRLHRPGFEIHTFLCIALLAVQVAVACFGGVTELYWLFQDLGLSRPGILAGQVWQFATHALLHGGWVHLLFNWIVIFLVGGRIHHILGGRAFAKVFFGGVLLGSVLHLLLHPRSPLGVQGELPDVPLVGASAGAMALLLVLTGLSPDSKMWPLPISGKNLGRGLLVAALMLFAITPGVGIPGLSGIGSYLVEEAGMEALFTIGHVYHFGGGLAGFLCARHLLRQPVSRDELQKARERREGIVA